MKSMTRLILIAFLCICGSVFARQCAQNEKNEELFRAAEARIRKLDRLERMLLNEYLRGKQHCCFKYSCFYRAPQAFIWDDRVPSLRREMIDPYFVSDRAALLLDTGFLVDLTEIKEDRAQTHRLRSAAGRILRLADELGVYPDNIYRQSKPKPAQAAAEPVTQVQSLQEPASSEPGTILAVAVGEKSLCMIEGVDQVLSRGDAINQGFGEGVKVVKLEHGRAELQKGKRTWTQKVGESPSDEWK